MARQNERKPCVDALCAERNDLAAYLDDELDANERENLENHLCACAECVRDLAAQRQLLGVLSGALSMRPAAPYDDLPADFTRVVIARAQTDMSGMHAKNERRRSLVICAALIAASAVLCLFHLAFNRAPALLTLMIEQSGAALRALDLIYRPFADAGASIAIVLRAVGRQLLSGDYPPNALLLLLLMVAALALPFLISQYHRVRPPRETNG